MRFEISNSDRYLVDKIDRLTHENSELLDQLLKYREWHLANEEILKTVPISKPPYEDQEYLLDILHAKYCPHHIVEE